MKINRNKSPVLYLMTIGIALFIINTLDIFLEYNTTHGKGF